MIRTIHFTYDGPDNTILSEKVDMDVNITSNKSRKWSPEVAEFLLVHQFPERKNIVVMLIEEK